MELFFLPIYSRKRSPIPHIYSWVKSLLPQIINYSRDKSNMTSIFNPQSEISNLLSFITTHQLNTNEFPTFEMIISSTPPDGNQLLIQKAKNKNKMIDQVMQRIELQAAKNIVGQHSKS